MDDHLIFAYEFDGKGGGKPLTAEAIAERTPPGPAPGQAPAWVHLDAAHPDTQAWLETRASYLDPFIVEALLAEETSPRMTQIEDGVLLILRGVNLNDNAEPEDMVSLRMWIDKHRIISLRRRNIRAARDVEAQLKQGKGPEDVGGFICMLVDQLFERAEPVLSALDDMTDDIEEKILENADTGLRKAIVDIRMQAIMFRRHMAPQRNAISQLRMADVSWLTEGHRRELQEAYNHFTRFVEDLEAIRERAQIVKDELANIIAERLNRNMYVLSVIAAIFLPLGFLTGLLGINVGGIPGAEYAGAFVLFCGILVVIVAMQILVFRHFKWF